ncbi:DUF6292 family protein [Amycolatopsis sp. NPDC051758]|uniref:DUF6292 family protein n=1 Tax=Amycolatopsis sp. NPDC051758 TaxID=3363935 RepID=UPI0037B143AE
MKIIPPVEAALPDYIRSVATELGLPAEDATTDSAEPMCAEIRFAGRPADRLDRDFLLIWDARDGWQLAATDGASTAMHVIAALPGPVQPDPRTVADFTLNALGERGERLVRRQCDGDRLAQLLDRHTAGLRGNPVGPGRTPARGFHRSRPNSGQ